MRIIAIFLLVAGLMASEGESDYQKSDANAMLGIGMEPPSSDTQAKNGTDADTGVAVNNVYGGTAAERMGLQSGDLIKEINGTPVTSMTDLRNEVALAGVGGQVDLVVLRNGQQVSSTSGTLGEWPKTIPYEPIDAAAERRFRDWQGRRLERSQQAAAALSKQIEGLERLSNKPPTPKREPGSVSPAEAATLPISEALAGLPAWKLHVRTGYTTKAPDATPNPNTVAWDARILVGAPAPEIF